MQIWSAEIKELESLYSSIKGQYLDLEKELEQLTGTKDANVILIYSRRCLEVIITDLCECELKRPRKTEPLKGIIDRLGHEEKVPSHIIVSMQYLNSICTFGAHPKDFDPEQIKPVLSNLVIIIKWYLKYKEEKAKTEVEESYKLQGTGDRVHGVERQDSGQAGMDAKLKGFKETDHISNVWKRPTMIISGILIVVMVLYIVFDQFKLFRKDKFEDIKDQEGKISIAVMPFENQTGDTTLNWFQRGMASLIINGLGNSSELSVLDDQTMFEVMESMNQVYTAGISPSQAREVARKVKAETYISGSFQGMEDTYWVLVNLVKTGNGEIIWTREFQGNLKSKGYRILADSLCNEIKNYLEIKALEDVADYDFREAYPNSADAYRYFIEGVNSILTLNYDAGIKSLEKALEIDSTFTFASFYIAYAYSYRFKPDQATIWTKKAYANKEKIPPKYQLWLEMWYACIVNNDLQETYRYCNLLEKSGINSRLMWFDLGVTYYGWYDCNYPRHLDKAIKAFEKVMEISLERGGYWQYELYYDNYGHALHLAGKHEKEEEIYDIGRRLFPDGGYIIWRQAVCALSMGDTIAGNEYLSKFRTVTTGLGYSESIIEQALGQIYKEANLNNQAEAHFRKGYELDPQNIERIIWLSECLINYNINVDEGMELVQKGLKIQPDNKFLLWIKGRDCYKQGKYEEAVQLLRSIKEQIGINAEFCKDLQEAEQALANQNK